MFIECMTEWVDVLGTRYSNSHAIFLYFWARVLLEEIPWVAIQITCKSSYTLQLVANNTKAMSSLVHISQSITGCLFILKQEEIASVNLLVKIVGLGHT